MKLDLKKYGASAFTVVELILVLVIIGVLATLTIVAYKGVQQNAHQSAVMSDLDNSAAIMAHEIAINGAYPATLSAADGGRGLPNSGGTTYQYVVNNALSPPTFCLTGTNSNINYYISSSIDTPTQGTCPGDGSGGAPSITNLATTPKPLGANNNYAIYWGAGGNGTTAIYNDAGLGRSIWRATWSTASTSSGGGYWYSDPVVIVGQSYQLSQTIRSSKNITVGVSLVWIDSSMSTQTGSVYLGTVNLVAGVPQRIGGTAVAPSGTGRMRIIAYSTGTIWSPGDTLDTWDTMFVKTTNTTLYNYADGSYPNWTWTGTPNNSSSQGPPV